MANTLRFKRGLAAGIPTGVAGEPLFTTDTFDLYIGNGTTNTRFQKYIASGTTSQYLRGDGSLATFPSLTGFVPYTGATANVDLGVYTILAQNATISSSGSGNTATITHSSGSGIALNITKGGNGEGLYINKTSGTGNAATIIGTLNATTLVKSGGTSTQYLMADGTTSTLTNPITGTGTTNYLPKFTGASTIGNSLVFDNGTNVGINTNVPSTTFQIKVGTNINLGNRVGQIVTTAYQLNAYNDAASANIPLEFKASQFNWNLANTDAMRLDASGNLGLGVTPSAWALNPAFQIKDGGSLWALNNQNLFLSQNMYFDGSFRYIASVPSSAYQQSANSHLWLIAPSGTAGNAITFTQAMTLTASGRLLLGTTTEATYMLDVNGSGRFANTLITLSSSNSVLSLLNNAANGKDWILQSYLNGEFYIGVNGVANYLTLGTTGAATFSSSVTANAGYIAGTGALASDVSMLFKTDTGDFSLINQRATHSFGIYDNLNTRYNLNFSSTGDATFSSSVTAAVYQITPNGTNPVYNIVNSDNTYAGRYILQAGGGSAGYGGSVIMYGHAHATKAGWVTAGISKNSGGKFSVNTQGLGGGTDVFTVDAFGNMMVDTNTLYIDASNDRVGIGLTNPSQKLHVTGTVLNTAGYILNRVDNTGLYTGASDDLGIYHDGTNSIIANATGALIFSNPTEQMRLDSTGLKVSDAIAIGTTPDTNNPFKILKNLNTTVGIKFENTNTSSLAFSAVQLGTDITGGTKFTNLVYASSGISASGVYNPDGTSLINNGSGGLNFLGNPIRLYTGGSNGVLRWDMDNDGVIANYNAFAAPTTSSTDGYKQYSADVTAGNAAPHFRTENGAVIKLYQETTAVGNSTISIGGGSAVLDDTEFGGYTLRQVVKALQNQGILA